jgi:bifunctional polynucleotide phosphatase/kinase
LGHETQVLGHKFDPRNYLPANLGGVSNAGSCKRPSLLEARVTKLVILVGLPGAGKTTYYRNFLQPLGYEKVNSDDSGSPDKNARAVERLLLSNKSVCKNHSSPYQPSYGA